MKQLARLVLVVAAIVSAAMTGRAQDAPLNVAEWRAAIDILERAAELIEDRGWYQVAPTNRMEMPQPMSLSDALEQAWKDRRKSLIDFDYARFALDTTLNAPPLATLTGPADPVAVPFWGRYYDYWNDAPGRTEGEVINALQAAIEFARAALDQASANPRPVGDLEQYDRTMIEALFPR